MEYTTWKFAIGIIKAPLKWIFKHFNRPELDIEVVLDNQYRRCIDNADPSQFSEDGICLVNMDILLQHWLIEVAYSIHITNNSEHTATNIQLIKPQLTHNISINPPITFTKPLKSGETRIHTIKYHTHFTGLHTEATDLQRKFPFPEIELRYKNFTKLITYFTKYRHDEKEEFRNTHGML